MNAWLGETFLSLRVPGYRVLFFALLANFAGLWSAIVSRGYLTYDLTDSATALGAVVLGFGMPMLVLSPVGGVIADRLPRRTVVIVCQWVFAGLMAVQAAVVLAGAIEFWMLFVAALAEGAVVAIAVPARQALIGDLVGERDLGNAVALQQVSFNSVRVIAPTVAGTLIAVEFVGVGGTFALQAAFYAAAAMIMGRLPRAEPRPSEPDAARASPLADILDGVRYVRRRPAILVLVMAAYAVELTAFTYFVFVPAMVSDLFDGGSVALGVLTTAIATGAFAASLVVARIADRDGAWAVHGWAALAFGPLVVLLALAPGYAVALVVGVGLGAAEVMFLALNQALSMRYAHAGYYGRVQAVLLFGFALNGIAALPVGLLADAFGLRQTLFGLGAVCTALVALVLLRARRSGAKADARTPAEAARAGSERATP